MLHRWVVRPLLELAYVAVGVFVGTLTFTVAITMLSLGVGLMPAFLLGVPVLVATAYVVHALASMERLRAEVFLETELPARPMRRYPGVSLAGRLMRRITAPEFWKESAYALALLPVAAVTSSVSLALYAAAFTGLLLPAYADALTGDEVITWLGWSNNVEIAAGFIAGAVCLVLARLVTTGFALAHRAMAQSLLCPNESDALRAQVTELRETRARVVDAADAERRRIERDLHDGTQQHLVALAMNLGRAKAKLDSDPEAAKELVTQAHQDAKDSITALRNVVRGVHPAVLTDRGLDAALSALAARSPVPVRLDVDVPQRPSATVEAVAYFVVSEALTNVAKHSQATRASVHVERMQDRLLVSVSDDGRGGAVLAPDSGLAGLRDRVQAVDGTFHLQSSPEGGTTVSVEVPCAS